MPPCTWLEYLTGSSLIALLALVLAGSFVYWQFLRRLANHHPEEFMQLGSPAFLVVEGDKSDTALFHYLLAGKFARLGDRGLSRLGNVIRTLALLVVVVFVLFLVLASLGAPARPFLGLECLAPW